MAVNGSDGCKESLSVAPPPLTHTKWISPVQRLQPSHMERRLKPDYANVCVCVSVCVRGAPARPRFTAWDTIAQLRAATVSVISWTVVTSLTCSRKNGFKGTVINEKLNTASTTLSKEQFFLKIRPCICLSTQQWKECVAARGGECPWPAFNTVNYMWERTEARPSGNMA